MKLDLLSILVAVITVFLFGIASASDSVAEFAVEGAGACYIVQTTLGVPTDGQGIELGLAAAQAGYNAAQQQFDPDVLGVVVSHVLAGTAPDYITSQYMARIRVDDSSESWQKERDWRFFTDTARYRLTAAILAESERLHASGDTELAWRFGRAGWVLAANDLIPHGCNILAGGSQKPVWKEILKLNDEEWERLTQVGARYRIDAATMKMEEQLTVLLDRLISTPADKDSDEEYSQFLAQFGELWKCRCEIPALRRSFVRYLWRFSCLARNRGLGAVVPRAEKLSAELRELTRSKEGRRWLLDAVTVAGPIPKDSGLKVIRSADDWKPERK